MTYKVISKLYGNIIVVGATKPKLKLLKGGAK